ncbi:nucleotide-diphospho-sugar transferase [Circinella umbellata]|nr:nucleotide-diphospho-sugar transferase [Circinella umbellata]
MASIQSFKRRTILRIVGFLSFLLLCSFVIWTYIPLDRVASSLGKNKHHPLIVNAWPPYENPQQPLRQPHDNFNAAYVTFIKGDSASLAGLRMTIRQIEFSVNKEHHYPYIIFSNEELSDEFKHLANVMTPDDIDVAFYDKLDNEYYGYANSTDQKEAEAARIRMNETLFGDSEDYRFSSRFMAGLMFRHPALKDLDYIWRFEGGTEYICPVNFDPFAFMKDTGKKVSFSIALYEYEETIPSLFSNVMKFASENSDIVQSTDNPKSLWDFVIDDDSQGFNKCHFWNNFQIADMNFFRGELYQRYFDFIDNSNGIFYERWGDPVIQTLGMILFLEKSDIQFWENIGYRVADYFTHCPSNKMIYKHCSCRPSQNFDYDGYSCLRKFFSSGNEIFSLPQSTL